MAPCENCQKEARKLGYLAAVGGVLVGAVAVLAVSKFRK